MPDIDPRITSAFRGAWLACLALCIAIAPDRTARADEPEEAVKIFDQLRPSVVSIDNSEGSGTGVVLDSSGLILTCAHVVTSPLAYEVKVDVGTADEPKIVTFKKVQIVGYHPERDLALIRIDPKEQNATLVAAAISRDKASAGQRIYAIGDPGVGQTVLTKTITQGIVSGVDREVDQQKFYQIDAAINPGNSGGPVVDHTGSVLGLVTFKFANMEATNFAIPLRDIDFTKFVSLTEHKANPQRADELVKDARQFNKLAQKAAGEEGADSDAYKLYTFYAAYCYAEALIDDPSNPDIYSAIGTQDITMDNFESAAAYLVRAIELRPWSLSNGTVYHELGVAYKKQKLDDKAIICWKEGLAKFPYAASLWDDQAVYSIDKQDYATAAYSASVSLSCGTRKGRVPAVQQMLRDARTNLDADGLSELARLLDHDKLCDALEKLRQKSNASRRHRSLYMTTAFVDLMKQLGTLDVPGVEEKISQVPVRAPENLAVGDDVTDGTDSAQKKKPIASVNDGADDAPAAAPPPVPHMKPGLPGLLPGVDVAPPDGGEDDMPPVPRRKKKANPQDGGDDSPSGSIDQRHKEIAKPAESKDGGDWIGGKKSASPTTSSTTQSEGVSSLPSAVSVVIAPTPAVTGIDLAGESQAVDDARMVPLDLDNEPVADAILSPDGSFAYVLQKDGLLRKVAVPSLKEERQTNLASTCIGLGMTRRGLAVYVNSAQEIWMLDPGTLEVQHRVPLRGVVRMCTARISNNVLVSTGPGDLQSIDPITQTIIARYAGDGNGPKLDFRVFALSHDAKQCFCSAAGSICRLNISNDAITIGAHGPRIGGDPKAIVISPDSRYIAMPCGSGNTLPGELKVDFATYVFKTTDLDKPVMTLASGPSPQLVAFDFPARQIYAQNDQKQLIVYSPAGDRMKDYVLDQHHNAITTRFLVHPQGRSLMMLINEKLDWVTLP